MPKQKTTGSHSSFACSALSGAFPSPASVELRCRIAMIVVTSPTGQIGQRLVRDLVEAGASLRIVARDPEKIPRVSRDAADIITGSHGSAAVIDRALDGADALFWLAPPDVTRTLEEVYLDFTQPAVEAIRRHQVKRVVSVTALGRGTPWAECAGLVTASIRMDDLLMGTGAAFRGLAMPSFMDNLLRQAASIRDQGLFYGPIDPDRKAPTTATRDMSAFAARLLVDESWTGQEEVPVLGPDDLSQNDMAQILSDVVGRNVQYQQTSFEAFKAQLLASGASESFAQGYVDMMRSKDGGMDTMAERGAKSRTPTSFREWCELELKPAVLG